MRKILFIAYYFPPIGGGGVQRSLKFVKYLPQLGWKPIVLTSGKVPGERYTPRDQPLLEELPPEAQIHRVQGLPSPEKRTFTWRLSEWTDWPTPFGAAWSDAVLREGARLCEVERPDVIYVSMSPFEGAAAASILSRRFQIPWVADLRDPWALDEMQVYPSGLHRNLARRLMRDALKRASVVIMNTPEAGRRLVSAFPEYGRRRVISLTNGFDAEDYAPVNAAPSREFRIVHTGSLHTGVGQKFARRRAWYEGLGRIEPGVDFLTRSHVYLVQALERWLQEEPSIARDVRLVLAGSETDHDRAICERSSARALIEMTGHCTHVETVRLQQQAALLFLPMHNLARGRRATIVPGKTYEYLATGRPILAAVPPGDARDFVQRAGTGLVCEPNDVDGMLTILRRQYRAWREQRTVVKCDRDYIDQFERLNLTTRLAAELDRLAPVAEHQSAALEAQAR